MPDQIYITIAIILYHYITLLPLIFALANIFESIYEKIAKISPLNKTLFVKITF